MSFKKFATIALAVSATLSSFSAHALHSYTELSKVKGTEKQLILRNNVIGAIKRGHTYKVDVNNKDLVEYYKTHFYSMKLVTGESKYRILDDPQFYKGQQDFAGQTCAVLFRYGNELTESSTAGFGASSNSNDQEQTPLYATGSQYYKDPLETEWPRGKKRENAKNLYKFFLYPGKKFDKTSIFFGLHQSGVVSRKHHSNDLVLTMNHQSYYINYKDQQKPLVDGDPALYSFLIVPSLGTIVKQANEQAAYDLCHDNVEAIVPHR